MQVVQNLDADAWRDFVERNPRGNIFHTPEMFQVFARVSGHKPALWAVIEDDSRVLALVLPIEITLRPGLLRPFTTRAVAYGSVLSIPGTQGQEALALWLQTYCQETQRRVLFTELRNLSDLSDLQPVLKEAGFVYEGHLNFLIDLTQSEETLWGNVSKSGRQSVRTSRKKGTVVEEVTERQQVSVAYGLLQKVYARAQVPLADVSLFEAAFDVLAPRGMFKIFLAHADEHYISACLFLLYKDRIIYWYGGTDRAFSAYAPNELLLWHAMQWGQQNHFKLFDLGGAGQPDKPYGPRDFKAKFGGELVNFGRNTCVHSPLRLKISEAAYRVMRRFL